MDASALKDFKYACKEYLSTQSIDKLRSYGRNVGVDSPTKKKKEILIEEIVSVLTGDLKPVWTNLGAPVKNDYVPPEILETVDKLRVQFLTVGKDPFHFAERYREIQENPNVLRVEDPDAPKGGRSREIYRGQLAILDGVPYLLPLDCKDSSIKLVVSVEQIRVNDLREGDVVTCFAENKRGVLVASDILTINGLVNDLTKRVHFDDCDACFPTQRIRLYEEKPSSFTEKCFQWLIPLGKGQRGCISASPKSGKTTLLTEMATAISSVEQDLTVLAVLIDQPPENIGRFRKILKKENFVATTYEDSPERQVFTAQFMLNRAKRLAERGFDVVLFVDSLTALARAFNETTASEGGKTLSCGWESKTLHFIKKYFGSARSLEKGGSITILATVATATGNPADDILYAEISALANMEIRLSDHLAIQRVFPAVELQNAFVQQSDLLFGEKEAKFDAWLRSEYLPSRGEGEWRDLLADSKTYEEFTQKLRKDF